MIFPVLDGLLSAVRVPMTWVLLFLNLGVHVVIWPQVQVNREALREIYNSDSFLTATGEKYAEFIRRHPEIYESQFVRLLGTQAETGDREVHLKLGEMALRDYYYAHLKDRGPASDTQTDPILGIFHSAREKDIRDIQELEPSRWLGVSHEESSLARLMTFQFVHGGFAHLFGNMILLLLLGSFLEVRIGSAGLGLSYLWGGFLGGATYLGLSPVTNLPLIGASAGVSCLMGMVVAIAWREGIRVFYMWLPVQKYVGFFYLPSWVLFLYWFIPDITGVLKTVSELGGVAHLAHVGGVFAGLLIGVWYRLTLVSQTEPSQVLESNASVSFKPSSLRH